MPAKLEPRPDSRANRQTIDQREALERFAHLAPWRPDFRGTGLEWILGAICIAVPIFALLLHACGGPSR